MQRFRADTAPNPCWPAFHDAVRRYKIPHQYFHEMIDGVTSDLEPREIQTFDELYRYCYQVASVVGLTITHIFGFDSPEALRACREVRHRVPAHQHHSRRQRGSGEGPDLFAPGRSRPVSRSEATAGVRSVARAQYYAESGRSSTWFMPGAAGPCGP